MHLHVCVCASVFLCVSLRVWACGGGAGDRCIYVEGDVYVKKQA